MATDTPPGHGSTQYLEARHRVHATTARLRRRAHVVGALNYAHFAGPRLVPTAAAVGFGIPPDQPRDPRPADPGPGLVGSDLAASLLAGSSVFLTTMTLTIYVIGHLGGPK